MAGTGGNQLMGFCFPELTIICDASAIENTVEALIEEQTPPGQWFQSFGEARATSGTTGDSLGYPLVVTLLRGGSSNLVNAANS